MDIIAYVDLYAETYMNSYFKHQINLLIKRAVVTSTAVLVLASVLYTVIT